MQTVTMPVVSAITAGVLIVGQIGLMFSVVLTRVRTRQSLGEGDDAALLRRVRRHGNYAENAAIFVVCLALVEMIGAARPFVIGLAALFIVGRVLHAIGLSLVKTTNVWRIAGIVATVAAALGVGVRLVTLGASQLG
jgi:uncharacterized membrane protein YecN with MAPEG domain